MVPTRRILLSLPALLVGARAQAASESFAAFLNGVRAEARRAGVSANTVSRALDGLQPNDRVLELDRRQPEFTQTWEQYRDARLSQQRIDAGRRAFADNRATLETVQDRFRVSPRIVTAIWGLETNYGGFTGNMNVIQSLATLAWDGRRSSYFRNELMAALKILDAGHVTPDRMRGSWAGAMGHPQFMPSNFDRLAVDLDGDGRRDIWDNRADALGSIGNYLSRSGWRDDELWGREVVLPAGFDTEQARRENMRPLRDWVRMGVRRPDGVELPPLEMQAAVLIPGPSGQAFLVYHNFNVIRRYNPSNFYALAVGMLSDRVA
ncbi:lytic murein transglycosylase [Falsiroseomonas tokyonensis]|uniref:Lytic transglycosylase domain-containing protein n=1 Tax=Falsiroseomonas tokyonensis TaxID=430521 RepID=A0ABV7BV02_9PROT|nr:lytic murein transglycosylase [Falsiroseomonas tokyonensis]MBU8538251.1 lytic murein transglycosylase [Falsiroseomonas tokyonensis]